MIKFKSQEGKLIILLLANAASPLLLFTSYVNCVDLGDTHSISMLDAPLKVFGPIAVMLLLLRNLKNTLFLKYVTDNIDEKI